MCRGSHRVWWKRLCVTFSSGSLPLSNIILLNWAELGDTFRLGLSIAKMRANPVNRTTHEVEVVDGAGMRVLPGELRIPAEQHPFSSYAGLVSRSPERRHIRPQSESEGQRS